MIRMNGDTMDGRMNQKYLFCFRPPLCWCVRVLRVRFITLRLRRRDTLHRASIGYTVDRIRSHSMTSKLRRTTRLLTSKLRLTTRLLTSKLRLTTHLLQLQRELQLELHWELQQHVMRTFNK